MSSLEELRTEVAELKADVDEKVKDEKEKESTHKAALKAMDEEHKRAMDEKEHEKKEAMDEEHKKHESSYKSVYSKMKSAMEEETDEKKKEGMKAALLAMNDEHKEQAKHGDMDNPKVYEKKAEDDKKDREHKAEITYLTGQINIPKIKELTTLYQATKTTDSDITEYKAEWEKLSGKQLDAEIKKMQGIVGTNIATTLTYEAERSPFGFSTNVSAARKLQQFDATKISSKIDKMTDSELFNKTRPGVN